MKASAYAEMLWDISSHLDGGLARAAAEAARAYDEAAKCGGRLSDVGLSAALQYAQWDLKRVEEEVTFGAPPILKIGKLVYVLSLEGFDKRRLRSAKNRVAHLERIIRHRDPDHKARRTIIKAVRDHHYDGDGDYKDTAAEMSGVIADTAMAIGREDLVDDMPSGYSSPRSFLEWWKKFNR